MVAPEDPNIAMARSYQERREQEKVPEKRRRGRPGRSKSGESGEGGGGEPQEESEEANEFVKMILSLQLESTKERGP